MNKGYDTSKRFDIENSIYDAELLENIGTGISFQHYLLDLRLEFSHNLIKYGKRSCTEACFESGFKSIEYFSSALKKKYGYFPKNRRNFLVSFRRRAQHIF